MDGQIFRSLYFIDFDYYSRHNNNLYFFDLTHTHETQLSSKFNYSPNMVEQNC